MVTIKSMGSPPVKPHLLSAPAHEVKAEPQAPRSARRTQREGRAAPASAGALGAAHKAPAIIRLKLEQARSKPSQLVPT